MFQQKFDLLQVKRDLIPGIINFVYELFHKLPNNGRLKKLGNIRIISKLAGGTEQYPASLSPMKNYAIADI